VEKDPQSDFEVVFKDRSEKKEPEKRSSGWEYLGYAGQIGYGVALPIVVGALGGKYLDDRFGTGTKFTLMGLGAGTILSVFGFVGLIRDVLGKKRDS
jgi:hypothetical protein